MVKFLNRRIEYAGKHGYAVLQVAILALALVRCGSAPVRLSPQPSPSPTQYIPIPNSLSSGDLFSNGFGTLAELSIGAGAPTDAIATLTNVDTSPAGAPALPIGSIQIVCVELVLNESVSTTLFVSETISPTGGEMYPDGPLFVQFADDGAEPTALATLDGSPSTIDDDGVSGPGPIVFSGSLGISTLQANHKYLFQFYAPGPSPPSSAI